MRKIFLIIFLILFLMPLIARAGLVPCGLPQDDPGQPGDQTVPCQLCHFFVLFKKVVDFLLINIIPSLAILMLAIGGFMYVFAYVGPAEVLPGGKGGPAMLSQAKKLITSVIFGLLIIFAAWILVNTFFQMIGINEFNEFKTLPQNWWQINCPTPTSTAP